MIELGGFSCAGPAYASKATRNGARVHDLLRFDNFADKLRKLATDGKKRFPNLVRN